MIRTATTPTMRWRIAIGGLAVIGIAGAVYFASQPKEGTVEWHKQEYFALRYPKTPLKEHVLRAWDNVRGRRVVRGNLDENATERLARQAEQLSALEKLGYLQRRVIVFTNRSNPRSWELSTAARKVMRDRHVWRVTTESTNGLLLIYAKEDSGIWDAILRRYESQ